MKKIILTGGGSAGHVTPNLALIPKLKDMGYEILYVGSFDGIEKGLCEKAGLAYRGISTGKLRRYFDIKNLTDPFKVIKGFGDAKAVLREFKPDIVFSKGGFVSVPLVFAAHNMKIPVISHESDMTPGLANKLSAGASSKICCNFPETMELLPKEKAVLTGTPIREELLRGDRAKGLKLLSFSGEKTVLMVIGGSLGARHINEVVRASLDSLLSEFDIVHICGKGNIDHGLTDREGYRQFEYVDNELKDYYSAADMVLSRAGANAICEILALKKPAVLVPLPKGGSRGDQILNANSFKEREFSEVLLDEDLSESTLHSALYKLMHNKDSYIEKMSEANEKDAISIIVNLIEETVNNK